MWAILGVLDSAPGQHRAAGAAHIAGNPSKNFAKKCAAFCVSHHHNRRHLDCPGPGIKFLIVPLAIGGLAYLIGYGEIENGLPLKVVIVLTTMPVAFSALIPPSIYDLDLDLANACWFFTTACLIWVLPALLFVIEFISS